MQRGKWDVLEAAVFNYEDEADSAVDRAKRKYGGIAGIQVGKDRRQVKFACACVNVWMVVARKPWREQS